MRTYMELLSVSRLSWATTNLVGGAITAINQHKTAIRFKACVDIISAATRNVGTIGRLLEDHSWLDLSKAVEDHSLRRARRSPCIAPRTPR